MGIKFENHKMFCSMTISAVVPSSSRGTLTQEEIDEAYHKLVEEATTNLETRGYTVRDNVERRAEDLPDGGQIWTVTMYGDKDEPVRVYD